MPPKKQTQSTAVGGATAGTLLTDMAYDSNVRTNEKSKKLQQDYEGKLEDLEDNIDETVTEDKRALLLLHLIQPPLPLTHPCSSLRQAQLTRLLTLIQRRSAIEAAIAESNATIYAAYENASKQLRRAIIARNDGIIGTVAAACGDENTSSAAADEGEDAGADENKENEAHFLSKSKQRCSGSKANKTLGQDRMEGVEMQRCVAGAGQKAMSAQAKKGTKSMKASVGYGEDDDDDDDDDDDST